MIIDSVQSIANGSTYLCHATPTTSLLRQTRMKIWEVDLSSVWSLIMVVLFFSCRCEWLDGCELILASSYFIRAHLFQSYFEGRLSRTTDGFLFADNRRPKINEMSAKMAVTTTTNIQKAMHSFMFAIENQLFPQWWLPWSPRKQRTPPQPSPSSPTGS